MNRRFIKLENAYNSLNGALHKINGDPYVYIDHSHILSFGTLGEAKFSGISYVNLLFGNETKIIYTTTTPLQILAQINQSNA
jgi:hypothetical protein